MTKKLNVYTQYALNFVCYTYTGVNESAAREEGGRHERSGSNGTGAQAMAEAPRVSAMKKERPPPQGVGTGVGTGEVGAVGTDKPIVPTAQSNRTSGDGYGNGNRNGYDILTPVSEKSSVEKSFVRVSVKFTYIFRYILDISIKKSFYFM
jgi:hypothetical protein